MEDQKQKTHGSKLQSVLGSSSVVTQAQMINGFSQQNRYGKMIVLFQNQRFLFTIGPDYCCFICAFIIFAFIQVLIINEFLKNFQNPIITIFFIIGAIIQQLSYFCVALSNPGIATNVDFQTEGQYQAQTSDKICKVCNIPMLAKMIHCRYCNVCIKGYDHHCPWISKCVGKNNISRFYFFASFSLFYMMACMLAFLILI